MFNTLKINEFNHILELTVCFMLLVAAEKPMLNIQKTILNSIADDQPGFHLEGYSLVGLLYSVLALCLWFRPYINYFLGSQRAMVISAIGCMCYTFSFATESQWVIVCGVVLKGAAVGIMWPAQGYFLVENSSPELTSRNFEVFWFIMASSSIFGNIWVYVIFYGKAYIDQQTRRFAVYFLAGLNALALLAYIVIPKSRSYHTNYDYGPIKTAKKCWHIFTSPNMKWMALAFGYAGLQQSFLEGIYSSSVGFTLDIDSSPKELVPLSGIFIGIGSLLGFLSTIIFGDRVRKHTHARKWTILTGIIAQLMCYVITFLILPDAAVFSDTLDKSIIQPSPSLAMAGSLLLGYGDSCLATQIFSYIGNFHRDDGIEACAIYTFIKGLFAAISFYSCSKLGLHSQVTILVVMAVIGCFGFCRADRVGTTGQLQVTGRHEPIANE